MSLMLAWLAPLLVSTALFVIFATAVSNARSFPRLHVQSYHFSFDDYAQLPSVAVLIPARNEAAGIGATVSSILAQNYPHLQLIVLDDHSDDGTRQAATAAAGAATHFRLICGQPLPPGWMGKNWACHQLALAPVTATAKETVAAALALAAGDQSAAIAAAAPETSHADGDLGAADVLIFADADVFWQPGALAAVVAELQRSRADLLTVWPTQTTVSWGERLTVPLMALAVLGYLPLRLAHDFYHPLAAAANGQCMVFRREAYAAIGGHASVRSFVVEDVRLAQRIKAAGLKLRMADGNELILCRMYAGWHAAIDGYAKNILAGHGNHISLLLLSTLFHWAVFVWPWFWLAFGAAWLVPGWPLWPLLLIALGVGARAVTAAATHQRMGDALLMPFSVILMTWVALRAIWWRWRFGGVIWKGRILRDA